MSEDLSKQLLDLISILESFLWLHGKSTPRAKGEAGRDQARPCCWAHVTGDGSLEPGVRWREELASSVGGTFFSRGQVDIQIGIYWAVEHTTS